MLTSTPVLVGSLEVARVAGSFLDRERFQFKPLMEWNAAIEK